MPKDRSGRDLVVLTVPQARVIVRSLKGHAGRNTLDLWTDIRADEDFPAVPEAATYTLRLYKEANSSHDVRAVEAELCDALKQLSHVWHFAGGTVLGQEHTLQVPAGLPEYQSNASDVEHRLLEREGIRRVNKATSLDAVVAAGYSTLPLVRAAKLAQLAQRDRTLEQLFEYHWRARFEPARWYIHFHNLAEVLERSDRFSRLGINPPEVRGFKSAFSDTRRGLRHPPLPGQVPENERKLYHDEFSDRWEQTRTWIEVYVHDLESESA